MDSAISATSSSLHKRAAFDVFFLHVSSWFLMQRTTTRDDASNHPEHRKYNGPTLNCVRIVTQVRSFLLHLLPRRWSLSHQQVRTTHGRCQIHETRRCRQWCDDHVSELVNSGKSKFCPAHVQCCPAEELPVGAGES